MSYQHLEMDITINQSIGEIFSYISNSRNNNQWMRHIESVEKTTQGPIDLGTGYRFAEKVGGQPVNGELVVHCYEKNLAYGYKAHSGSAETVVDYSLQKKQNGTCCNVKLSVDVSEHSKIMRPIVLQMIKRRYSKDLFTLKAILEA